MNLVKSDQFGFAVVDGIYRHPTDSEKGVGNSELHLNKNQRCARHER